MPYKNIKPDIWGPHLWRFLHYLSLSYPENPTDEEKEIMLNFLESLQEILPCEKCRYNFNKHLDNLDMKVLDNNINFIKWVYDTHNEVNRDTGKPILSYDDFIKMYSVNNNQIIKKEVIESSPTKSKIEDINKEEKKVNNSYNYYIIIGILIVLILIISVHRYY